MEPVYEPRDLGIEQLTDYEAIWMRGEELHGGGGDRGGDCSNGGDGSGNETYSTPDDPPGGDNEVHKEQKNNQNKLGVVVGTGEAGLIETASWTTIKMLKLDLEKPATFGTKMLKNIKGVSGALGIAGGLVSGYMDFQAYQSGSMTFNEFLSRSGVTLLEVGVSFVCPPAGFVLSTVDVCGGLDWFYKKF